MPLLCYKASGFCRNVTLNSNKFSVPVLQQTISSYLQALAIMKIHPSVFLKFQGYPGQVVDVITKDKHRWRGIAETFIPGALAAGVSYVVGDVLKRWIVGS
ncbi:hypothetical protein [Pontibacter pudoricolor]|uniref:hypothetical protein n=1 Tax=Pontibacter pudoricolor TaxID=2694930 RepID=UPI001391DEB7|nr:hypothetical protein [Pontibacter pudoricolor]